MKKLSIILSLGLFIAACDPPQDDIDTIGNTSNSAFNNCMLGGGNEISCAFTTLGGFFTDAWEGSRW